MTKRGPSLPEPSRREWDLLTRVERVSFRLANLSARRLKWVAEVWHWLFLTPLVWLCIGRRLKVVGLDELKIRREQRLVVVANHSSFFDFVVVAASLHWWRCAPRRMLFPVRANFFYDRLLGLTVNLLLSGMCMFPPLVRESSRAAFNRYAINRIAAELNIPGTMVGLHPEGRRKRGKDAHKLLPARPGVGKVVLGVDQGVRVIPVFVGGLSNSMLEEFVKNWTSRRANPVELTYGQDIDFSDLRAHGSRPATDKQAADRCLQAIAALGAQR